MSVLSPIRSDVVFTADHMLYKDGRSTPMRDSKIVFLDGYVIIQRMEKNKETDQKEPYYTIYNSDCIKCFTGLKKEPSTVYQVFKF